MTGTYHEFRAYSPYYDAEMIRLSVFDERGQEYFQLLPASNGKSWRERRAKALDLIDEAIAMKLDPGQVIGD